MSTQSHATVGPTPVVINRLPLWLAVAVTVVISLPFGLWLGTYNFTLWCAFISWAEYFAMGATLAVIPTILVSFGYSAILTGVSLAIVPLFGFLPSLVTPGDASIAVALFIGVAFMVYSMGWFKPFQTGSLAFFNGISMALAIYFSGQYPHLGPEALSPIVASAWGLAMAAFGIVLGMLTVVLQLPTTKH